MGLSSSQARLLSLTSRQHDIEYKAQHLEAQKLQMANESTQVYQEYENALNSSKVQYKTVGADGSATFVDATYNNLLASGYKISSSGAIAVTQADVDYFNNSADKNAVEFACLKSGYCTKTGSSIVLTSDNTKNCIFTAEQLKTQAATSSSGKNYVLMDDITVTESMGDFSGNLDGNGHTINVNSDAGLFNNVTNSNISNLNLVLNINKTGLNGNIGGLANNAKSSTISNINVSGNIKVLNSSHTWYGTVGGLVGGGSATSSSEKLTLNNITSTVNINTNYISEVAGILGDDTYTDINNSYYSGSVVDVGGNYVGGIANCDATHINNCIVENSTIINTGDGVGTAGGIAGVSRGGNITNCIVKNTTIQGVNAATILGCAWNKNSEETETINNIVSQGNTVVGTPVTGSVLGYNVNDTDSIVSNISEIATDDSIHSKVGSLTADKVVLSENTNTDEQIQQTVATATANVGAKTSETNNPASPAYNSYLEIAKAIQSGEYFIIDDTQANSNKWLTNMLNAGTIILSKADSNGNYSDTNVATDTGLQEVSDDTQLKKAEAKYEADMRKIDAKDKKFDTDLAALETERNAIKTEVETLKTVAKDNVDRTFKLFS